jgi:prephenate dehydratase
MAVPHPASIPARPRVAFLGGAGAFSEEAVVAIWPDAEPAPVRDVFDVARAVAAGQADAGVLPVENTVAGGVVAAYDALTNEPTIHAIAETILRVNQCLLAPHGATVDTIESVSSHPVALAQCTNFLTRLGKPEFATSDTATAAREVATANDTRRAAVAGRRAAEQYGLAILVEHIEDRPDNQTRFLGVGRVPLAVPDGARARTSLVFTTANQPGALLHALEPIAHEGLNLSKLESRPTGEPWTYRFFADVDHIAGDTRVVTALATLKQVTQTCRILGTYVRAAQ